MPPIAPPLRPLDEGAAVAEMDGELEVVDSANATLDTAELEVDWPAVELGATGSE